MLEEGRTMNLPQGARASASSAMLPLQFANTQSARGAALAPVAADGADAPPCL